MAVRAKRSRSHRSPQVVPAEAWPTAGGGERRAAPIWWPVVGLLLLSLAIYSNNLANGLVSDDEAAITGNQAAHGLGNLGRIFTTASWWQPGQPGYGYRPLTTLTFAANYSLHGLAPLGYHLVNDVLHGLAAGLVYLVLLASGVAVAPALIAAALFAAHPVHTEAVSWAVGRAEVLSTLFMLLALRLHIAARQVEPRRRGRRWGYVAGVALSTLLAGLSKETGYTTPLIVLTWDMLVGSRAQVSTFWQGVRTGAWREYALYGGLLIGFLLARSAILGGATAAYITPVISPLVGASFVERLLTGGYVLARYVGLLLWPAALSVDYSPNEITRVSTLTDPHAILGLGALLGLLALLGLAARRSPLTAFALGAGLLALAPVSNIAFPIGTIMAERLLYLPVLGLCVPLALGLWRLRAWERAGLPRWLRTGLAVGLALVVIGGYSGRTLIRNADWQSNFTLFQSAYQVSPSSASANQHWALELRRAGRPAEAIPLLETAIAIQPRFPEAHYGLAGAYVETGRPAEAIPAYQAMLGMVPNTPFMTVPVYLGLGNAYQEAGRHEEALDALDTALRLNPQLVQARFARVHLLVALRRVDEARGALAEAESRFPNHPAARSAREELGRASGVEPSPDP